MRQWLSTWKKRLSKLKKLLWKSQSSEKFPLVSRFEHPKTSEEARKALQEKIAKELDDRRKIIDQVLSTVDMTAVDTTSSLELVELCKGKIDNAFLNPPISPEGFVYQWVRFELFGELDRFNVELAKDKGYFPVPPSRHPEYVNKDGVIQFGGQFLCEKPIMRTVSPNSIESKAFGYPALSNITCGEITFFGYMLALFDKDSLTIDDLDKMYQTNWSGTRPLRPKDLEMAKEKGFNEAHIKNGLVWSGDKVVCEIKGAA